MASGQDDGMDIFYVSERALKGLREALKKGGEVKEESVNELAFPEKLKDDEVMVPVDMRGVGEQFDDVEQMIEKLGAKGTTETFVKAADYFDANKDKELEEERPKPMTAAEWKQVLEEDAASEGAEEELLMEGEEEDICELGTQSLLKVNQALRGAAKALWAAQVGKSSSACQAAEWQALADAAKNLRDFAAGVAAKESQRAARAQEPVDDEEEGGEEGDASGDEPAAKKAKTD